MDVQNTEGEISIEQIVSLSKELKKKDKEWAHVVFKKMKAKDSSMKDVTKVHNIKNGSLKNQKYRVLFVIAAGNYLAELKIQQEEALKIINQ